MVSIQWRNTIHQLYDLEYTQMNSKVKKEKLVQKYIHLSVPSRKKSNINAEVKAILLLLNRQHNSCKNVILANFKAAIQARWTIKLKIIKNVLKRRKECGTYLATARRHRWRVKKLGNNLPLQLMKAAVLAESYTLFIILDSPAISTGSRQVGAALFPSF